MKSLKPIVHDDGWGSIPDSRDDLIHGKTVKFNNGDFFCGERKVTGDELLACGAIACWLKWGEDGKPAEVRVTRNGDDHPRREDLPDQDQRKWPLGMDGEPADPWRDLRYLYLLDCKTAAESTFVTGSYGGRRAVADLSRQIGTFRCAHPKATPTVRLDSEPMKTRFGLKPKPLFSVIGWRGTESTRFAAAPPEAVENQGDEGPYWPSPDEVVPF